MSTKADPVGLIAVTWLDRMRTTLTEAAVQFQLYADQHEAKTPPDTEKAATNRAWATRCLNAVRGD